MAILEKYDKQKIKVKLRSQILNIATGYKS